MTNNIKNSQENVVEVKKLVKRYNDFIALDHLGFAVRKSEIFGLLGPNGSGKTTAINCILAVLSYDKGEIKVFGEELKPDSYDIKAKIGIVPQDLALIKELTVRENIDFFCGLYIDDKAKRKPLIDEAIEFCGLEKFEKFKVKKLSGGLKRRLNIACGIVHKPELIIMDEPTVAVDAQSRQFILDRIKELKNHGATVIYTTHYLEEAEDLCERILIIDEGKSIAEGSLEELKDMIDIGETVHLSLAEINSEVKAKFQELEGLQKIEYEDEKVTLTFDNPKKDNKDSKVNRLYEVMQVLENQQMAYRTLYSTMPGLNEIFLSLTGRALRD